MPSDSDEGNSFQKIGKSFENKLTDLSQVITKGSVAAAGINVDTPIVSAIIGNLIGTLPTKKNHAKQIKCQICNCSVSSSIIFQKHLTGAKHQKKLKNLQVFSELSHGENAGIQRLGENQSFSFVCEICPLEVNSASQLQNHLSGERHKRKAERLKSLQDKNKEIKSDKQISDEKIPTYLTPEQKVKKSERDMFTCSICNLLLNSRTQQIEHMNSKKHKLREKRRQRR